LTEARRASGLKQFVLVTSCTTGNTELEKSEKLTFTKPNTILYQTTIQMQASHAVEMYGALTW